MVYRYKSAVEKYRQKLHAHSPQDPKLPWCGAQPPVWLVELTTEGSQPVTCPACRRQMVLARKEKRGERQQLIVEMTKEEVAWLNLLATQKGIKRHQFVLDLLLTAIEKGRLASTAPPVPPAAPPAETDAPA